MRKFSFFIWFLMQSFPGICQPGDFKFPTIPETGKTMANFVPQNWKIVDSIKGDFNMDHLKDIAFVIQSIDSIKVTDTKCFSSQPFFPKMVVILLRMNDGLYRISALGTKIFGSCNWGIQGSDPFNKLFFKKKLLGLQFQSGGTLRNIETFYFLYKKNKWNLAAGSNRSYQQGQSDSYVVRVDLMSGTKESYSIKKGTKKEDYKITKIKADLTFTIEDFDGNFPVNIDE